MNTYDTTNMTCTRIDSDIDLIGCETYLINDSGIDYVLEFSFYYDIEFDITRKDGIEVTQEEREKVMQCYYEL
jgi:hypothetical protein